MVVTCFAPSVPIRTWHDRVGTPSICTVQAPHWAIPQPYLVPVSPIVSRNTQSSGVSGSTSTSYDLPLTESVVISSFRDCDRKAFQSAFYDRHRASRFYPVATCPQIRKSARFRKAGPAAISGQTEISLAHRRIVDQVLGGAAAGDRAGIHYIAAVGKRQGEVDVLLDQKDGNILFTDFLKHVRQLLNHDGGEAEAHLVDHQELRARHQPARHCAHLLLAAGHRA